MMKKQQSGFTLIELVIVIVILGLLAATALPRFADLTDDAEAAAADGLLGAVRSASAIAHAQALVRGQTGTTGTVTMEGVDVALAYGYPTATSAGIGNAVDYSGGAPSASGTWSVGSNCTVGYVAASSTGGAGATPSASRTCTP